MNVFIRSNRLHRLPLLIATFFMLVPVSSLQAKDSPISSVLDTAKALVDIQSVNATLLSGQPQGFIDKATGQMVVTSRVRPVSYTRSGRGVIIDPRGLIVTNAHIISGAGGLAVTLFDGTLATVKEAHLVPGTDLAFLLIDLPFAVSWVPLADADGAVPGANVYTVGNSQWLKGSVIGGKLMSVLREEVAGVSHVTALRLNFDMEYGDSGCPVLNAQGKLLGIVGAGTIGPGNVTIAISSSVIAIVYKDYLKKIK